MRKLIALCGADGVLPHGHEGSRTGPLTVASLPGPVHVEHDALRHVTRKDVTWYVHLQLLFSQIITDLTTSNHTSLSSYSSGGRKSKMSLPGPNSRCLQGHVLSGTSRTQSVSLAFPVSGGRPRSLASGPVHHQSPNSPLSLSHQHSSSDSASLRDPVTTLGPSE